jgi:hypothetical protein
MSYSVSRMTRRTERRDADSSGRAPFYDDTTLSVSLSTPDRKAEKRAWMIKLEQFDRADR